MMHMFGNGGMAMGPFGTIFMVLFWILVLLGIIFLIRGLAGKGRIDSGRETAEEILNRRYARGEISKEEFDRMRQDLRS